MSKPRISVVMSVYKEPVEWLHQSIDSILNQTFSDFEFVIICDNPEYQEGIATLKEYAAKDKRIKLIFNEENIGLTKSLNKGLTIAQGEYIARMDADDISLFTRLEKQMEYMKFHPEISVCGSAISFFGNKTGVKTYPLDMSNIWLFLESCFAHPSVMIRTSAISNLCYDEKFVVSQDYNLWVEMFMRGALFGNVEKPLLHYRYSNQQIMSTKGELQIKLSKEIRRKALRAYFEKQKIEFPFDNVDWRVEYTDKIISGLKLCDINVKRQLYYYSFLSVDKSLPWLFFIIVFHGYFLKMHLKDIARIFYFKIRGIDYSKF